MGRWSAGRKLLGLGFVCAAVLALVTPAAADPARPWLAAGQTPAQRADELLARMTLDEKLAMVIGTGFPAGCGGAGYIPADTRLGIPALCLGDGPNGVGNGSTGVTEFPVATTAAATWDPALVRQFGATLGAEQSAKGRDIALAPTINILRTPLWGRESETYGEDPYLTGQLAASEIQGIQSQHVIATVKHYAANNQETDRSTIDEQVSQRALEEIYYPGFAAALSQGGTGAVMCAYPLVNGAHACENPALLGSLERNFGGFVMSDWFATHSTLASAAAGLDMEMPGGTSDAYYGAALKQAVLAGQVPRSTVDEMVRRILTPMFAVGLFDHPVTGSPSTIATGPAHQRFAAQLAEQGTVLLKNDKNVLPLSQRSVAVIGDDAGAGAQVTEGGSGGTAGAQVITPIAGITARAGSAVRVSYARGTLGTGSLPVLPATAVTAPSGVPGWQATYYATPDFTGPPAATRIDPAIDFTGAPVSTLPSVWSARWTATLTPATSGLYRFSLTGAGSATRVLINGRPAATMPYSDLGTITQGTAELTAGRPVTVTVEYSSADALTGASLHLGYAAPDPALLAQAVAAARHAQVAVVFADDYTTEGNDRTSLDLPGDQNQLIDAVAAANPHTVVVLNTGGPVLMPWLNKVSGVIEAWYPGQEDGTAIASVLFGDTDPSGRLPETFPAGPDQGPASTSAALGNGQTVDYAEGIDVGYRWYAAHGQQPLFPFGYGLSYTTFRYSDLRVLPAPGGRVTVRVRITNTGRRSGDEVAQLYVGDPASAQEPPEQLKGFQKVSLAPGQSTQVTFQLTQAELAVWNSGWTVQPGQYRVMVGGSATDIREAGTFGER